MSAATVTRLTTQWQDEDGWAFSHVGATVWRDYSFTVNYDSRPRRVPLTKAVTDLESLCCAVELAAAKQGRVARPA